MSTSTKTRPAHEVRIGRIKATIWEQESEKGPWYNIRISRIYKDKDDWKDSNSFGRDDLLVLEKVINRAYDWLIDEAAGNTKNGSNNGNSNSDDSDF